MKFENERLKIVFEVEWKKKKPKKETIVETVRAEGTDLSGLADSVTQAQDPSPYVLRPGVSAPEGQMQRYSAPVLSPDEMAERSKKNKRQNMLICSAFAAGILIFIISWAALRDTVSKPTAAEPATDWYAYEEESSSTEEAEEKAEGNYLDSAEIAQSVKDKYEDDGFYEYGDPIYDIARDETITLPINYDPKELGIKDYTEMFGLYKDPDLQHPALCYYDRNEAQTEVYLYPSKLVEGYIGLTGLPEDFVKQYDHSEYVLFEKDLNKDWGNYGTYYLATYRDRETGEVLEKPIVQVVTVKGEIENRPKITFLPTEKGLARFTWDAVEGAEQYLVVQIDKNEERGMNGPLFVIGTTAENEWTVDSADYGLMDSINKSFRAFKQSEEDGEIEESTTDYYYGVIAISKNGSSMLSNVYSREELAANLPYCYAYEKSKEQEGSSKRSDSVELTPTHAWVTMCDGKTVRKLIDYDIEEAEVKTERYFNTDENGEPTSAEDVQVLKIPYQIEGTPYFSELTVMDYVDTNYDAEMAYLEERQDGLRQKSGTRDLATDDNSDFQTENADSQIRCLEDVKITANSALSEYLATAMLGGGAYIDISDFKEASDMDFLQDALLEAYYQNPLILGMEGADMSGSYLLVNYDNSQVVQAQKQQEVLQAINQVITDIIRPDMTELEKELAINEYLCENLEYDFDALASAEENDFATVDESVLDSFNAYGALVNHKCVCAGYSAAFKLLADAAGLDSIVVTGMLDGTTPHAWNKVNIDGKWMIVDSTNNDSEFASNALLNIPDYASSKTLVEDKGFVLDRSISKYAAETTDEEFYRISDKYFDVQDIADKLVEDLKKDGKATLRTDYELDDDIFYSITDEVYSQLDETDQLSGGYWLGVIYLALE